MDHFYALTCESRILDQVRAYYRAVQKTAVIPRYSARILTPYRSQTHVVRGKFFGNNMIYIDILTKTNVRSSPLWP